jgi:hypothetical protein
MMHSSTQPCNEGLSCGGHPTRPSRGAHRPSPQRKRYLHLKRWIRRQYRPRLLQRRMSWCGAPRLNWNRCARRSAALPPRILARACGGCSSGQPKPLETRGCSSGSCSRSCSSCSRSCRSSNISIAAAAVAARTGSARKLRGASDPRQALGRTKDASFKFNVEAHLLLEVFSQSGLRALF